MAREGQSSNLSTKSELVTLQISSSHTASYKCMLIKIRFAFTYYPYTSKPFFLNYIYCVYSKFKWTILNHRDKR